MQQFGRNKHLKSRFSHWLRASVSLLALSTISACGGGAGGADTSAPVQLGAALPEQGDYIAITQKQISLSEASRVGSISVSREGQAMGASSVSYRFVAGSASATNDFRGTDGTLNWASGETGERTVQFQVDSDTVAEGQEDFYVELFDVDGQDELGINDRVTVSISDSPCTASVPASIRGNLRLAEPCYRLDGIATVISAQLDINAGTTIVAASGSALLVTGTGTLNAQGSPALPVIIKGATDAPGHWSGISLQSSSALHRVNYTEIANADNAVHVFQGALALFDNNTLKNNAAAAVMLPLQDADTLGKNNTFTNNVRGIELVGNGVEANQTVILPAQSSHYVMRSGLLVKGTLKLEAGTDLRMSADVPVLVTSTGAINAVGTVDNPIHIGGLETRQGFWNGIQYVSSTSSDNRFEHTTIAHGGGDPARAGNIIVDGLDTHISLLHCAISHSAGYGIKYDSSSFQIDQQAVTYSQNRLGEQSL